MLHILVGNYITYPLPKGWVDDFPNFELPVFGGSEKAPPSHGWYHPTRRPNGRRPRNDKTQSPWHLWTFEQFMAGRQPIHHLLTYPNPPPGNEGLYNKALLKGKQWVSQARKIRPAISGGAYVRRGIRLRSHHLAFLAWWKRPIQISHGDHLFDVLSFTCFIGTKGLKRWLTWKTR